jgi:CubicO group peptidase (beta-lactamase class C family)
MKTTLLGRFSESFRNAPISATLVAHVNEQVRFRRYEPNDRGIKPWPRRIVAEYNVRVNLKVSCKRNALLGSLNWQEQPEAFKFCFVPRPVCGLIYLIVAKLVAPKLPSFVVAFRLALLTSVQGVAASDLPALSPQVDGLFADSVHSNSPGAAVLIARDGKIVLEKGYGLGQVEAGAPITCDTRFRIGSITKQFTAAAILKLEEQGKLSVNDPVSKYIPDWPKGREVTLRHLLNHSSGIHNFTDKPAFQSHVTKAVPLETLVSSFKNDSYDFDPGKKFRYSNSGYVLLGLIVEKVSGESYDAFLRKTFFEPLGMTNTGVYPSGAPLTNEAFGYSYENGAVRRSVNWDMSNVPAAGNLYSTARDLFVWNESLFAGKVLSTESARAAFTVGILALDDLSHPEDIGYGYGWTMDRLNGAREISHGGELAGFGSYLLRLPDYHLTVVVLLNCVPQLPTLQQWVLAREIARRALGPELPSNHDPVVATNVPTAALDAITGRYDMGDGMTLAVSWEGDHVFMEIAGRKKFEILPKSDRTFFVNSGQAEATFVRNASDQVVKVILRQAGDRIDAPKLDH